MSESLIEVRDNAGIVRLTINRPKALNALNSEVIAELERLLVDLEGRDDLRAVLITGLVKRPSWPVPTSQRCAASHPSRLAISPARHCGPSSVWRRCRCRWWLWSTASAWRRLRAGTGL